MTATTFFVPGRPRPQPRPRFANGHAYTPDTAKDWKAAVVAAYVKSVGVNEPTKLPVALRLEFYFQLPKSKLAAYGRGELSGYHSQRPDLDNLEKAVMDALTDAGAWADDCQVVSKKSVKVWAEPNAEEGCGISITT